MRRSIRRRCGRWRVTHARDLPDVGVNTAAPDFRRYAAAARDVLARYEPEDRRLRLKAAEDLAAMPVEVQLFGLEPDAAQKKSGT